MKKFFSAILSVAIALTSLFSFSGCGIRSCMGLTAILALFASFEEDSVQDPAKYGEFSDYVELPVWFPESIAEYEVKGYSYRLLAYMDICYEVYVNAILSPEQFDEILDEALNTRGLRYEQEAYYADGFYELVFEDEYSVYDDDEDDEDEKCVGWATVEKLVYNPDTYEVVFECLHAHDTGVYPLLEVAYFNRFGIDETEYVAHANIQL